MWIYRPNSYPLEAVARLRTLPSQTPSTTVLLSAYSRYTLVAAGSWNPGLDHRNWFLKTRRTLAAANKIEEVLEAAGSSWTTTHMRWFVLATSLRMILEDERCLRWVVRTREPRPVFTAVGNCLANAF